MNLSCGSLAQAGSDMTFHMKHFCWFGNWGPKYVFTINYLHVGRVWVQTH